MKRYLIALAACILIGSLSAQSKGLQFLQSLAVPGLSQIRDGRDYGYAMLASEVGIISTIWFLNTEEKLKQQEYYEYALKYAHINPGSYDDQYYRNLSRYNSSGYEAGGYNAMIREQAMEIYPNDPVQQQIYIDGHVYPDGYAWNWDSLENRAAYSKIRIHTQDLRDYGTMAVGVLIANHLISGIDVLRYFSESNRTRMTMRMSKGVPMLVIDYKW
jgi:hypothetical protein